MRFSSLHNHTVFSDGVGTVKENIDSAVNKNLLSIGFSDHSFTPCDTSYCMKKKDYPEYIAEINRLKEEYKNTIPVFCGLEMDYFSEIQREKFDYIIASVHYIIKNDICYPVDHSAKQQLDCVADAFGGNIYDMAKHYFELVIDHARKNKPDIIGHFDVLAKFSLMPEDEKYYDIAKEALKETIKYCDIFEINTGAISRGYRTVPYPDKVLLGLIHSLGGRIVINADSHNPKNIDYFFNESAQIAKDIGFKSHYVFNGKTFDEIAL